MSRQLRLEWLLVTLLAGALAAALPLHSGFLGWSWDALNHHVYLGLIAQHPRWHLDVIPASVQSYQYPFLYWPVYLMSQWPGPPVVVAAIWAGTLAMLLAVPLWLISFRLLPAQASPREEVALRLVACAAAFMSLVIWAALETTANDLLASVPLLWAIAMSLHPTFDDRRAGWAATLWGVSAAFKLSNGLFLPWLLLWWYRPAKPHWPLRRAAALAIGAILGFGLAYLPWGIQLWQATGNPFHPLLPGIFGAR